MNFLNPSILFALGASALPLIIHFLSRRRARELPFPSIELLEHMKTESIRRLRFKQLLLILLRTLIIIAIVLAFARPSINGAAKNGSASSAAIILDDSAGMHAVYNGEMLFETAKRLAVKVAATLGERDELSVVSATSGEIIAGGALTGNSKTILSAIEESACTLLPNDSGRAFGNAIYQLSRSIAPNRELYYIGDGFGNALPDSLAAVDFEYNAFSVLTGPETCEGLGLESIALTDPIIRPGFPLTVRVNGFKGDASDDSSLEFFVDGERVGRVQPSSGESTFSTTFTFTPEEPGLYSLLVRSSEPRFEEGESIHLVADVRENMRVLFVSESPESAYFIDKALFTEEERPPFKLTRKHPDDLTAGDFTGTDIILMASVTRLDDRIYRSLAAAVIEHGVGLIVFPADDLENGLYTDGIFRDLAPLNVERLLARQDSTANGTIGYFDMHHRLLAGITGSERYGKPKVARSYLLTPSDDCDVLARFDDRSTALLLFESGRGKTMIFPPETLSANSEFAVSGLLPALLLRSVHGIAVHERAAGAFTSGENPAIRIPFEGNPISVTVRAEGMPARSIDYSLMGGDIRISELPVDTVGFYSLFADNVEIGRYAVDIPRSEREMTRSGIEKRLEAYNNETMIQLESSGDITSQIRERRIGNEIDWLFYLLAALLIAAEMIVSRKA